MLRTPLARNETSDCFFISSLAGLRSPRLHLRVGRTDADREDAAVAIIASGNAVCERMHDGLAVVVDLDASLTNLYPLAESRALVVLRPDHMGHRLFRIEHSNRLARSGKRGKGV